MEIQWKGIDIEWMAKNKKLGIIFILFLTLACAKDHQQYHEIGALSPNNKYRVFVIKKLNPVLNKNVYCIEIVDVNRNRLFLDSDSDISINFKIYWRWDLNNILWLYDSDTGRIFFFQPTQDVWVKHTWDKKNALKPPPNLTPY